MWTVSLRFNTGVRAVFSFRGKNCKEGESLFPLVGHRHRKPYKAPRVLPVRISVELTLSIGLHILPKDLDSLDLYRPNQKQEDPCRVWHLYRRWKTVVSFACSLMIIVPIVFSRKSLLRAISLIIKDDGGNEVVYRIDWKDVVFQLDNSVIKSLKIRWLCPIFIWLYQVFCIFISQKAGYGYGQITIVDSSEARASGAWDLLASCLCCCEDMSDEMKSQYVEYLIERLENAELDNRVMRLVLEDLSRELPHSNQMLEKSNELQSLLEEERNLCKSLDCEI